MNCRKNAAKKIISLGLEIPTKNPCLKPPSNDFDCDDNSPALENNTSFKI